MSLVNSKVDIQNCNMTRNQASWRGAGLHIQNGTGTVKSIKVYDNRVAHHHGAGVSIEYFSTIDLSDSVSLIDCKDSNLFGKNNYSKSCLLFFYHNRKFETISILVLTAGDTQRV